MVKKDSEKPVRGTTYPGNTIYATKTSAGSFHVLIKGPKFQKKGLILILPVNDRVHIILSMWGILQ